MTAEPPASQRDPEASFHLQSICGWLSEVAPLRLAESWDNVGLLVGDRSQGVHRVMTCLTIAPAVVEEAVSEAADLIVAHHPLPFKALQRITSDTLPGAMLLRLISAGCAIYSAHTAFDSAAEGINQAWADHFEIAQPLPLVEADVDSSASMVESDAAADPQASATAGKKASSSVLGAGRYGRLPEPLTLDQFVSSAASMVGAQSPRRVGIADQSVSKVAFACGSGGSFLSAAKRCGCDALLTGEATFHTCLEAESLGIGLGLVGHYWSERFAMERLAERLADAFPGLAVWPSRQESDPVCPVET